MIKHLNDLVTWEQRLHRTDKTNEIKVIKRGKDNE